MRSRRMKSPAPRLALACFLAACAPEPPLSPPPTPPAVPGVCARLEPDNASCPFEGEPVLHWKLGLFGDDDGRCRANLDACGNDSRFGFITPCSTCRECETQATADFVVHLPDGTTATSCGD